MNVSAIQTHWPATQNTISLMADTFSCILGKKSSVPTLYLIFVSPFSFRIRKNIRSP